MYILRDYQEEASRVGVEHLHSNLIKNSILVLPTAAGKSLIIADIAHKLDAPVLVLQPTKELLSQNIDKYLSYGNKASIYSASMNTKEVGEVTFATIGSVYKKPELFSEFKYILYDECHIGSPNEGSMHRTLFDELKLRVLGLTATPFRLKNYNFPEPHSQLCMLNRMRPKIFHDIIHVTQVQELIENNYWAPLIYDIKPFDRSELKYNSTGADYTDESLDNTFKKQNILEQAKEVVLKLKKDGRKQILVFVPTINSAYNLSQMIGCQYLTSKTSPKDRSDILKFFHKEWNNILVNINILATGYDNQKIDAIVDCVPTLSLARYYQRLGRGVRIDLSPNPTKKDCIIVDLVGNHDLFGKIEDIRFEKIAGKWSLLSGTRLLNNTPLTQSISVPELEDIELWFGTHKGKKFKEVPISWWKWISKEFDRKDNRNIDLFRYIDKIL